jgi:hypothetical protein
VTIWEFNSDKDSAFETEFNRSLGHDQKFPEHKRLATAAHRVRACNDISESATNLGRFRSFIEIDFDGVAIGALFSRLVGFRLYP